MGLNIALLKENEAGDISDMLEDEDKRPLFSDKKIKQNIYEGIFSIVEKILYISAGGTHSLDQSSIEDYDDKIPKIEGMPSKIPFNPIYWYLVLGENSLIDYISAEKRGEKPAWRLKEHIKIGEIPLDKITDEVMKCSLDYFRCHYSGVKRIGEYWQKIGSDSIG